MKAKAMYLAVAVPKSYIAPSFCKLACKQNLDLRLCFGPSTLGAGANTRLEYINKKWTPHCICRYVAPLSC